MHWENARDCQPADKQTVLVSINGIYRIATFEKDINGFQEINSPNFFDLKRQDLSVYWTEIRNPV